MITISPCESVLPNSNDRFFHPFADVSSYHYAGRMGNRGYRPSPAASLQHAASAFPAAPMMASNGRLLPITPTSTPSHRRPIFRSSLLEDLYLLYQIQSYLTRGPCQSR